MRVFDLLSNIDLHDASSWQEKIFLTLDVDWAHDSVILDTAELIENLGVRATWFFTHDSPTIDYLKDNGHEIGIHPNFNKLLSGDGSLNVQRIVDDCLAWCPDAVSTRSHSLVYGAPIATYLASKSVKYSSNLNIPHSSGIALAPWMSSSSLIEVPYSWADEHSWSKYSQPSCAEWLRGVGLLVADFHPIHVFLNTQTSADYENTRFCHQDPKTLIGHRKSGLGVRNDLITICEAIGLKM
jgi:hypothetical protein